MQPWQAEEEQVEEVRLKGDKHTNMDPTMQSWMKLQRE
jgi:hypothetical protein